MSQSTLRATDRASIALRLMCLQATWNYERQQGLGWAWALKPALERFYDDPATLHARLAEHTAYFNTQPTLASFAVGAVASLEARRAAGEPIDAAAIARVKSALGASLAALGDRLFWFTLRPFAALFGVLFAIQGHAWAALAMWVCYNLFHLTLRVWGVGQGERRGPAVFDAGLRGQLESLTRGFAMLGTAVVGVIVACLLVPGGAPQSLAFQATLAAGLGIGFVTAHRPRPSPTEWALGLGALCTIAAWMKP